jgi:hypothetical protein
MLSDFRVFKYTVVPSSCPSPYLKNRELHCCRVFRTLAYPDYGLLKLYYEVDGAVH